jgi:hypothetical protein
MELVSIEIISTIYFYFFSDQTIMYTHLEQFLAPLKRLRRLELVISDRAERKFLGAYRWKIFIVEHLSQLLTFNFKFFSLNIDQKFTPISPNCTTLPIEQHFVFYDCVTELKFDSDQSCKLPYRYNYVKKLILDSFYIHENILDLSKVQLFIVNTSEWSLYKIVTLIKKSMPSVNYLSLNCTYSSVYYEHFPNISLKQIRILCLPHYGMFKGNVPFNWFRLFPYVERLIASINSKSQIRFLIHQFKNIISGFFFIDSHYPPGKNKLESVF